jgi:hypothetical protein
MDSIKSGLYLNNEYSNRMDGFNVYEILLNVNLYRHTN